MDPKNPQPAEPTPVASPTPPPATPVTAPEVKKASNSPVIVTITVMVIIALGVAGFFFVKQGQNTSSETNPTLQAESPQITSEPTSTIDATNEEEIENIDIGDTDNSDLSTVQKDINSL